MIDHVILEDPMFCDSPEDTCIRPCKNAFGPRHCYGFVSGAPWIPWDSDHFPHFDCWGYTEKISDPEFWWGGSETEICEQMRRKILWFSSPPYGGCHDLRYLCISHFSPKQRHFDLVGLGRSWIPKWQPVPAFGMRTITLGCQRSLVGMV